MPKIGEFVDRIAPVSPDAPGAEILERFQSEPWAAALAVVDPDGRPVGLIERNAFTLKLAAEFGRALYARRPVSSLMDAAPPVIDGGEEVDALIQRFDARGQAALLNGFIAVEDGRYLGVGAGMTVLRAGAALHRERAETMSALARNLALAEAEATASSRAKSEFLAVMSHEIRTPLNGVLGVAGLMERKLEQEELRPYVRTILDSGQTLLRLLTDALDMSRAQAGMLTLEPEPVDLTALAADLDALWRARAEEKALALTVSTDVAGHDWVMGDPMRLKQMLNNLIGNALKFTQQGQVVVSISSRWADGAVRVEATVDDSGPGVGPDAAAVIFQPFNTGEAGREGAGAGLGLAICRQIAERMNGRIELDVSPFGGARFRVVVSLPCAGPEIRAASRPVAPEPTPHPTLHVLVVDDHAANRFVAGKLLETFGCTCEMAENGAEAVEAAQGRPFDLILMDIKMPIMDGVAATRAIRGLPGPAALTPILALTANADARDEKTYLAAGMTGVAQKPIQPDALLSAIRLALNAQAPKSMDQAA